MPVQTSYTRNMPRAKQGLIAWDFGTADLTSVAAQGVIPFGAAVVKGSAERTGIVGSADILGFAACSILNVYQIDNNAEAFGPTEMVPVMREGYIWIKNEGTAAILEGDDVYVNATGKLVNSAAAGAVVVTGSRVEKGGPIGEFILIRVKTGIPSVAVAP